MYSFYIYPGNTFNVHVKISMHDVKKTQVPTNLDLYCSLHMVSHCSAHSRGLKIIIGSSVIFAAVITLALVLFIYLGKPQVWIWMGLGYLHFVMNEMFTPKSS